jgi:hypothetical protein
LVTARQFAKEAKKEAEMADISSVEQVRRTHAVEATGAATESMGGIAVIVLTIIALAGIMRAVLTDIAGIIFGAAFIIEGAALAARQSAVIEGAAAEIEQVETGGMSVELVTGFAAIVLGILSLVGLVPTILMPALVITGGAGLIFSAGAVARFSGLRMGALGATSATRALVESAVSSAAGGQVLAGLAAVTLGIVALVGVGDNQILTTVGLLVLGAAITLSGTALSGKMLSLFRSRA